MTSHKKAAPELVFLGFNEDGNSLGQEWTKKLVDYILNLYSQKQLSPEEAVKFQGDV